MNPVDAPSEDTMDTTCAESNILVIIVTWNGKDHVQNLLRSLQSISYPSACLDVLVVDNASEDGTREALQENFPEVEVLANAENLGGTGGFNTGLARAFQEPLGKYAYIWLLDNDVQVHRDSLTQLVRILEEKRDVAIAGSTMMQLDYPWRINEMGSYLDRGAGRLILNRHLEPVARWQGLSVETLLQTDPKLDTRLDGCPPVMDVEYVAAASLLIRFEVAREAGLWKDYFIHYDDVEWCLRVAAMGWRVVVSARSLIWHLSGIAKVPTWVHYYDNRNMLCTMWTHGVSAKNLQRLRRRVAAKGVYYTLIGKQDIGRLHFEGLGDYDRGILGKKNVRLDAQPQENTNLFQVLMDPAVHKVLIPSTVNLPAAGVQEQIVRARQKRQDLRVDLIFQQGTEPPFMLPNPRIIGLSRFKILRYLFYVKNIRFYDLVFQSDYKPLLLMSLMAKEVVFINDAAFTRRDAPRWRTLLRSVLRALSFWTS